MVPANQSPGLFVAWMYSWRKLRSSLSQVKPHGIFNQIRGVAIFLNRPNFEGSLEVRLHANSEVLTGGFRGRDNFYNRETTQLIGERCFDQIMLD